MGMGLPLHALRNNVVHLEKTWHTWFNTPNEECAALIDNFEYLLANAKESLKDVEEEWRTAFPEPPKKLVYHGGVRLKT